MPRKGKGGHGGKRVGSSSSSYARRGLQDKGGSLPVTAGPSTQYGARTAQVEAQQAVPMGTPGQAPPMAAPPGMMGAGPPPGFLGDLAGPTARPGEPVTTGLPIGPGAGPEALAMAVSPDPVEMELRALYLQYPSEDLRELLEDLENGITF